MASLNFLPFEPNFFLNEPFLVYSNHLEKGQSRNQTTKSSIQTKNQRKKVPSISFSKEELSGLKSDETFQEDETSPPKTQASTRIKENASHIKIQERKGIHQKSLSYSVLKLRSRDSSLCLAQTQQKPKNLHLKGLFENEKAQKRNHSIDRVDSSENSGIISKESPSMNQFLQKEKKTLFRVAEALPKKQTNFLSTLKLKSHLSLLKNNSVLAEGDAKLSKSKRIGKSKRKNNGVSCSESKRELDVPSTQTNSQMSSIFLLQGARRKNIQPFSAISSLVMLKNQMRKKQMANVIKVIGKFWETYESFLKSEDNSAELANKIWDFSSDKQEVRAVFFKGEGKSLNSMVSKDFLEKICKVKMDLNSKTSAYYRVKELIQQSSSPNASLAKTDSPFPSPFRRKGIESIRDVLLDGKGTFDYESLVNAAKRVSSIEGLLKEIESLGESMQSDLVKKKMNKLKELEKKARESQEQFQSSKHSFVHLKDKLKEKKTGFLVLKDFLSNTRGGDEDLSTKIKKFQRKNGTLEVLKPSTIKIQKTCDRMVYKLLFVNK